MQEKIVQNLKSVRRFFILHKRRFTWGVGAIAVLCGIFYAGIARPPADFPTHEIISITEGQTLAQTARQFEAAGVVRSAAWLRFFAVVSGGEGSVIAGEYWFEKPKSLFTVAGNITAGKFGFTPVRVRIPEGATVREMAAIFSDALPSFDREAFLVAAADKEGYLFPDTYHFSPTATSATIVEAMGSVFEKKTRALQDEIDRFGRPLNDVVIMASILEKEAGDLETKRRIAGVLWRRLAIGMPLQVDASFVYLLGKGSSELSIDDLEFDSPYNTYKYAGLPPGPIASPSFESLKAAVMPIDDGSLYYLADSSGVTHFSETFDQHKRKKALYLN